MEQNQSIVLKKEDFYQHEGQLLMSLKELSGRLGYSDHEKLRRVYRRNKRELDKFKVLPKRATPGGMQETLHFNEIGCYVLAMFARTKQARYFREALANLLMDLRKQNLHLVPAYVVASLESKMKSMTARIRRLEGQQAVYYLAEKERLCSRRRWNMSKMQWKNITRMLEKGIVVDDISDMLAVPIWVVKKVYEIELHGTSGYSLGFGSDKTRAEIHKELDEMEERMRLQEAGNE